MAINQVIHGSNRVVENPNRYKLNAVSGQANTYDLEKMPGVITDNGTPYNKIILDKIDNVLSYLTPSVEKEGTPSEKTNTIKFMPTTWNELTQYKEYESSYTMPSGEIGNVKIYSLDGVYSNSYPVYYAFDNSNSTQFRLSKSKNLIIEFDEPIKINEIKTIVENASFYIDGSIDGINYVENLVHGTTQYQTEITLTLNDSNYYKYYRFRNVYGADQYTKIINIEFSNYTYHSTIYQNQFTLDNNGTTFTNNQRVLMETPSTTDLDGVTSNTLNGIDIPTLLQPSTKYELIYKEYTNKFEFGNLTEKKPLYDITLTEAVNQVDLIGIFDKLEYNKLYLLLINGKLSVSGNVTFGKNSSVLYLSDRDNDSTFVIFAKAYINSNTSVKYVQAMLLNSNGSSVQSNMVNIQNAENVKCTSTSSTFSAGTRIIIKEIS